jgi:lipoate-protein ligase A
MFLILDSKASSASTNMATDEFLFNLCQKKKKGFLRIYSWESPSFSYGVSQKINKAIDIAYVEKNKCKFVRRITGGKTVLHNDEITYSVISSEDVFFTKNDLHKSYALIAKVLVNAFNQIGIGAYLSEGSKRKLSKTNMPCFSFPTPNEIEYDGKKLVGSAQKRNNKALLQHGSIPLTMDYDLYANGAKSNKKLLKQNMITLNDIKLIDKKILINSLIVNFENFVGVKFSEFDFSKENKSEIEKIEKKYKSKTWNYLI